MEGLRPEVDELDQFKSRGAVAAKTADKKNGRGKAPKTTRESSSSKGLSVFMVLFLMLILAAFAWYSWQQQQEIEQLSTRLGDASGFIDQSKLLIARLEGRLSETGEVLAETGTTAEKKLAFLDSEMRKLWGVANDRNKKWIEENQAAIGSLDSKLSAVSADAKAFKRDLLQVSSGLSDISATVKSFDSRMGSLASELTVLRAGYEELSAGIEQKVIAQGKAVETFKKDTKSYLERLAKLDLSIESINASRRQLNERVVELDKKINEIQLKLSSAKP